MGRRLNANVVLAHPESGDIVVLVAGTTVPEWAADLITNEELFEATEARTARPVVSAAVEVSPDTTDNTQQPPADDKDEDDETEAPADGENVPVPPKSGKGSGVNAWRAYAASKGIEFDDDMKVAEIIEALAAENIPTE